MTDFAVLAADPPWQHRDSLGWRGAAANYHTMSVTELCAFKLPPMQDNATLFLWRLSSMQVEALKVCFAWGFTPHSELVWLKRTKYNQRHFGMGRIVRNEHETCLIATRGKTETLDHGVRSTFAAPIGEHSEKPDAFFQLVERLKAGPYCELFARKTRENWTCYGNEIDASPSMVEHSLLLHRP